MHVINSVCELAMVIGFQLVAWLRQVCIVGVLTIGLELFVGYSMSRQSDVEHHRAASPDRGDSTLAGRGVVRALVRFLNSQLLIGHQRV